MIHDPLAMTSSVPSVHNIRICIPCIATTVRICPRLERQTFPTHYCSIDFPWLPPFGKGSFNEGRGGGVRSAHLKLKGKSCRLN